METSLAVQQRGRLPLSVVRLEGKKPIKPDMVLKKVIRPALVRAGITDKVIGWHSSVTLWQPT